MQNCKGSISFQIFHYTCLTGPAAPDVKLKVCMSSNFVKSARSGEEAFSGNVANIRFNAECREASRV